MVILQRVTFTTKPTNCVQHFLLQLQDRENKSDQNIIWNNVPLSSAERRIIADILLDICEDCAKMASLPQGAFAACKLRDIRMEQDLTIARMKSGGDKNDAKNMFENKKLMEYSPVKYNGKLMNAIWGRYNRYSPHNIKGNEYGLFTNDNSMQQPIAVASFAIAQNLTMAIKSGNEWRFADK